MRSSEKILGIPRKFMDLSEQILGIPRNFVDLSEQILGIPRKFVQSSRHEPQRQTKQRKLRQEN